MAHLRQTGHAEAYINEFQRIAVMVPDMTQKRSVMLFIEGLQDMLKGLVRAFQLATLKDAIDVTLRDCRTGLRDWFVLSSWPFSRMLLM